MLKPLNDKIHFTIKVIDKKKARQDSYVLKNMKREPRIHQMVRHPHIVTLETENSYYMAMELCAGGDLMDRICERKRLEEREVRRYTRQILSASLNDVALRRPPAPLRALHARPPATCTPPGRRPTRRLLNWK
uniref:non-specific serine/threonine protein kinase n=1 Tax=Salarias fasciatus TaxID=181472 RepID=A0A672IMW4_SALFA